MDTKDYELQFWNRLCYSNFILKALLSQRCCAGLQSGGCWGTSWSTTRSSSARWPTRQTQSGSSSGSRCSRSWTWWDETSLCHFPHFHHTTLQIYLLERLSWSGDLFLIFFWPHRRSLIYPMCYFGRFVSSVLSQVLHLDISFFMPITLKRGSEADAIKVWSQSPMFNVYFQPAVTIFILR